MFNRNRAFVITNYALPLLIMALSILSATGLCSGGCNSLSNFRLFGTDFAVGGTIYALLLIASVFFTAKRPQLNWLVDLLVAAGLGAEIYFISIQKLVVKQWCPICLTIAGTLALFAAFRGFQACQARTPEKYASLSHGKWFLIQAGRTFIVVAAVLVGFMVSIVSVGKKQVTLSDQAKELESVAREMNQLENPLATQDIWFGDKNAPYEVYFISDWYCGFCRMIEPTIEKVLPDLGKHAHYTWLEMTIHRESLNISPLAMNVLLHDKQNYLKARKALFGLTASGKPVSEQQAYKALKAAKVKALDPDKGKMSILYMDGMSFIRHNKINQTPSVIIVDTRTGNRKVLSGGNEITAENLLKAVGVGHGK